MVGRKGVLGVDLNSSKVRKVRDPFTWFLYLLQIAMLQPFLALH